MQQYPLIVALDFPSGHEALHFLSYFKNRQLTVKVGMELFYREGPDFVLTLKEKGHAIFLDLKLHDIPTTVERAMRQIGALGVDIVNVHALGGKEMMKAAMKGLQDSMKDGGEIPLCVAVTHLTSTSETMMQHEIGIEAPLHNHILHLCQQVDEAGLNGVVCSAEDVKMIKQSYPNLYTVTPGIRRTTDMVHDQVRIMTPSEAAMAGSDAIVVGRGITRAPQPLEAYHLYEKDWRSSHVSE
ncbi:orotidine-5'-phosphate decarboxylase [Salipaludibacillus agaradhaerens]|uniref:Orotidine 5'-phosphate decarboxylase n=1 Tax=Salipaludibacillus agaradhaerens TaxID=76935 RepID=A0A9Q4FYQ4_SALAG|nr:orotidine-5'-phosphate decarboxylase [Salipaludibacillus agaradhaerens]MCR6095974.1 orotidine-5'-phosphate decarboxylase [Salipaludibacillus agaradhaerens]MCR6114467.1 orotidine-5'-phosphate decarboxylase [Salipaludibacillus agaradhaerens]